MKARNPQLPLRLSPTRADADVAPTWCDGAQIPYLGSLLSLRLDTTHQEATRVDSILHLPLPPHASPRQIQDGAEAWLRTAAQALLTDMIARHASRLGRKQPGCRLSFAARANWIVVDGEDLRCNWRLIEQPHAVIERLLCNTLAALPVPGALVDLFGAVPA